MGGREGLGSHDRSGEGDGSGLGWGIGMVPRLGGGIVFLKLRKG
jgi:hypothetical protein